MCVFFGSLGWPFLYLKLWTKYGLIVLAFFLAPTGALVVAEEWRPNSHFIAWHTSTTKSFCTWWNLFLSQKSWQDAASCLLLSLLLRSNLLHLSFDLFIEQKNIFQLLYQRLTRRNWLVRVAASAHFLYSLNRKKKIKTGSNKQVNNSK